MQQVMLFGEGHNGEVYDVKDGIREIRYIPDAPFPLEAIVFTVNHYRSGNGETYLIGYHGEEPLIAEVEEAIQRFKPIPV